VHRWPASIPNSLSSSLVNATVEEREPSGGNSPLPKHHPINAIIGNLKE